MKAAILGKKLGMTSVHTEAGKQIPCTVVKAGPCPIVQIKTLNNEGYEAIQIGFEELAERKVTKPQLGHFSKQGVKPQKYLKEFKLNEKEYMVGEMLTVEQFQKGDKIKVSGKSIGRGFQGVVKRHHFGGVGMITHGQSDRVRHPGSIGSSSYPSRVFKGLRMAGRMGGKRVSIRNLEIVELIPEHNIMLIRGSIPGPKNSIVEIIKQ